MITIKTENYNHISQDFYNKTIDSLDLTLIPCACGHSGSPIRYGSYKRNIQLKDGIVTLTIACFLASNFPHFHRYDSLKSALYIHAVSKNINTFPKNQGRIRAAIAVEILDFTVMYR